MRLPRPTEWLGAGVVLAVVLGALLAVGLRGHDGDTLSSRGGDLAASYFYWRAFARNVVTSGHLPLWNPHTYCGAPFAAYPESALFYPPNLIYLALPLTWALNVSLAGHVWLCGLLCFVLARALGCRFTAALLAGLVYMLCGPNFAHLYAGHISNLSTAAWLPLVLLSAEAQLRGGGWAWSALGGAATALMILAGHVQTVFNSAVFVGLYAVLRLAVFTDRGSAGRWMAALKLLALCALGAGIAAVQLRMSADLATESARWEAPAAYVGSYSFEPAGFLTFLMPGFFAPVSLRFYWGPNNQWEMTGFLGLLPLLLVVYGLAMRVHRPARESTEDRCTDRALVLAAGAMLLLAVGRNGPFFTLLYRYVFGFGRFRGWAKFLLQFSLAAALLAARVFERIIGSGIADRQSVRLLAFAGVAICVLGCGLGGSAARSGADGMTAWIDRFVKDPGTGTLELDLVRKPEFREALVSTARFEAGRTAVLGLGALVLLVTLATSARHRSMLAILVVAHVALDLSSADLRYVTALDSRSLAAPPDIAQLTTLRERMLRLNIEHGSITSPNLGMITGILVPFGLESTFPDGLRRVVNAINGRDFDYLPELLKVEDAARGGALLAYRFSRSPEGIRLVSEPVPRVAFFSRFRMLPTGRDVWNALASRAVDPHQELLVEAGSGPAVSAPPSAPTSGEATVSIERETPDSMDVAAGCPRPGFLYVADTWHAGWTATVDGRDAPIYRANYAFRAVRLEQGHHRVGFRFAQPGFMQGVAVSALSVFAAGVLILGAIASRGRRA